MAVFALPFVTSCGEDYTFDDTEIWESINDLKDRVAALEIAVAENVSAIQSMISLGSISSWDYDAKTGKGTITLLDGKTITINQNIKGYSLITVEKGEDGVYYWAICNDGITTPLEIDGKRVPVTVTPALKISENKEWLISVDGGKTWINTGIKYQEMPQTPSEPEDPEEPNEPGDTEDPGDAEDPGEPEVVFFKNVEQDGDYLLLTLVDGTIIRVAIVGEAKFTAAADTLWFSRVNMEKSVAVEMTAVKAYTVTEKPEGWKARIDGDYMFVTSPENFEETVRQGTVKVLATFEGHVSPEILSVEVVYEAPFTFAVVNGKLSVTLSEHTGEDFTGYVLTGWKKSEYDLQEAVAWLNENSGNLVPLQGTAEHEVDDVVANYDSSEDYVIVAVPYLPARQVLEGVLQYEVSDVSTVEIRGVAEAAVWEFYDVRFDSASFRATVIEDASFYGGFAKLEDWNNYVKDNFLETLRVGGAESCSVTSYEGPANAFPDGTVSANVNPATEYVVWYIAEKENGTYAESDFMVYTCNTPDVVADASIAAPTYVVSDISTSGFKAAVTPAAGAYKTYSAILKSTVIPDSEIETVRYLINLNTFSEGQAVNNIEKRSFNSEDEVYILAVSLTEDGKYGTLVKERVQLKQLTYSDALGVEVTDIEQGLGDVTLSLSFTGNPESITYMAAEYTFYTDEVLQKLLALGQLGNAKTEKVSSLNGKLNISGLSLGMEYTFYAVVCDAEGVASYLYKYEFTPTSSVDYILSTADNYTYGMPELSGSTDGSNTSYTLTLDVTMPSTCKKYWLFKGDSDYFTGDVWTDSDKLAAEQYMEVTVHTESISGKEYTYMHAASRIYMVWLDDNDQYHAIYEYNPKAK